jgi:phenylalanyl-tRNA synthetase alpha chain
MAGRIHPVSQVFDECVEIRRHGFRGRRGPDIETDDLNFTAQHPLTPCAPEHDNVLLAPKADGSRWFCTHTGPCRSAP